MQSSTLHIKVEKQVATGLKELAKKRNESVGELVRQAIQSCYQLEMNNLAAHQYRALAAYQGGYISLNKLAEEMGLHQLELRTWLHEHDITQATAFGAEDSLNA